MAESGELAPKTRKSKIASADELVKTSKKSKVELTEDELGKVSGGSHYGTHISKIC
jgi:hypothetical protein